MKWRTLCITNTDMKTLIYILAVLLAGSVMATEATFTIGMYAGRTKMTYLNSAATSTNYGTSSAIIVGDSGLTTGVPMTFFIYADSCLLDSIRLRSLPYIKSYVLKLKFQGVPSTDWANTSSDTMCAGRGRRTDWTEAGASWIRYKTAFSWSLAGARNQSNDIDTTAQGKVALAAPSNVDSILSIDLTSLFQTMDNTDTGLVYGGVILYGPWWSSHNEWVSTATFYSDDRSTVDSAQCPHAVVTLSDVPQPEATARPTRRRREGASIYPDRIREYAITNKGESQCVAQ